MPSDDDRPVGLYPTEASAEELLQELTRLTLSDLEDLQHLIAAAKIVRRDRLTWEKPPRRTE